MEFVFSSSKGIITILKKIIVEFLILDFACGQGY